MFGQKIETWEKYSMTTDKTPQLRVCVTPNCNLSCNHCRPGGEGYSENLGDIMSKREITNILEIARDAGFNCVKFTGGEPFMRGDLFELIEIANHIGFTDIQLVTNGTLIGSHIDNLANACINMLTVSLDAIDNAQYRNMRGVDVVEVIDNIRACRLRGISVRINMILAKSNFYQLSKMIEFAEECGCSLKLLDLIRVENAIPLWERDYLSFDLVREYLEKTGAEYIGKEDAPGGVGAPLSEYLYNKKLPILLKDSTIGTYYHSSCKVCKNYPCQDALISVRVTHDGKLKRCLIRNDNMVDILKYIRADETEKALSLTKSVFRIMVESEYFPNMFKTVNSFQGEYK
jgi:cyclic pyranopterin phosphate synthase